MIQVMVFSTKEGLFLLLCCCLSLEGIQGNMFFLLILTLLKIISVTYCYSAEKLKGFLTVLKLIHFCIASILREPYTANRTTADETS